MLYSYLYADLGRALDIKQVDPRTIGLLETQFGYTDTKLLGKGSFGTMIRFKRPEGGEDIAIKCLSPKVVRQSERKLWIKLRYPNLVTLLDSNVCWPLNVVCFEMRAFRKDLMTAVQKNENLKSPLALKELKTWLYQVLFGLNFLHNIQLCRLDLKSDNVLISRWTSRAMIGDFFLPQSKAIENQKVRNNCYFQSMAENNCVD
ncbi:hypothetical protein AVEN_9681-1 [Araneus ventricosus]|uniref:Protein kinase domain-containing protein n=1 Tax=Araneus ventricosus TaxID=182803 RepID=A0A4Y2DY82_ARAVE|nr:hypothetical protein AVEN_9681-1 [Araneus ventricosus]